jgi:LysM repeat protein
MTSSFKSTAFQSAARPVDTFVAQPSVLPKTDAEELADVLQTINPNLQKYIGTRLEKTVEEKKDKAFKMALDTVLADGTIGKVADATRKQDGDKAARQLIGGNIFVDRFYKQYIGELYGSQLDSNAKEAYRDAEIDTFNAQGEPIKRSIRSFAPTDPEFIDWRQNYFKEQTQKILDLGGEIDTANFITNLQTSVVNLNKLAREEHNEYNVEKVKDLSNDYFNKTAKDWFNGNKENAQLHITNFINDTRKLGLTGSDAKEIYTGLVENIANIGQYYVTTADVNDLDEVDDLIIGIGLSIPYGNNGGNLTQHPEWQEKIEPVLENLEDELNEELTQGPKIDKARRRIKLENKLVEVNKLPIDTEEQRAIYKQKIIELKNDRQFSDLNEVFKTNNYPYIEDFSAEIFNIRTNMRLRNYEDNESPLDQLGLIKNKIVDLGITDDGILSDLNQAAQIAEQYKSIYDIFDTKSQPLFDDIDAFYRSQAGSKGGFGNVNLGGGVSVNLGGLDNDLYLEKYNLEQKIDNDFEAWINENFYKEIDGKQIGGPSSRQIKDWLDDKRDQIEKNNFKIGTDEPAPSEGDGTYEVNGIKYSVKTGKPILEEKPLTTEEAPAFGNDKFEVKDGNTEAGFFSGDSPTTVTVEAGDTLSQLAEEFGVPLQAFMEANNITNADLIRAGQELVVPMVDMTSEKPIIQNMLPEPELNKLKQQIKIQTDNDQPLTKQQINKLLINAGFTEEQAKVMTAIAMAESANKANAFYGGTEKEPEESYGLFQINMFNYKGMELGNDRRPKLGIDNNNALYDPVLNALAAKLVFDETQAQRGNGYLAWGVYSKDGKTEDPNARYKKFLD